MNLCSEVTQKYLCNTIHIYCAWLHELNNSNVSLQVPPLPPVLVAKAAALRMQAHALSAENDFCDTCKLVVTEAASILGNLVRSKYSTLPHLMCHDAT